MLRIGIPVQYEGAEAIAEQASVSYDPVSREARWLSYVEAVRRSGAQPIPLTWTFDPKQARAHAEQALSSFDAIVLTGGPDVDPHDYGEETDPNANVVTELTGRRDAFERTLAQLAYARGVPTLGICRGIQVMNVALGGTLVQDIPSMLARAGEHQQQHPRSAREPRARGERTHWVAVEDDSLLARVLGEALGAPSAPPSNRRVLAVNSMHHQAVGRVAAQLIVTARACEHEPGVEIVEALEAPQARHPFYLGVQWHPEELARPAVQGDAAAADAAALFTALAHAAQAVAAQRRGAVRS